MLVKFHCMVLILLIPTVQVHICGTMAKGSNCYTFPIQLEPSAIVPQIYYVTVGV
jgi:hypothetical protein